MTTATLKDARMELKTTGDTKDLLAKAAAMSGVDMSAFVLGAAVDKARNVISEHSVIALSLEGQRRFAELLANPPKGPTEAMKKLGALPDFPERR
jgi:uncharacterized protein (DUF1778 family)